MKRILAILSLVTAGAFAITAAEPTTLVTENEILKVYNVDASSDEWVYYTLEEGSDDMKRIRKADVLIIKLPDGTKIDPAATSAAAAAPAAPVASTETIVNPAAHPAVTHTATTADFVTDKKGERRIEVSDGKDQILHMRLLSEADGTLAVTKWQGKGKYKLESYIIPEYVTVGDKTYTVVQIDDMAFAESGFGDKKLKEIVFPETLRTIGTAAIEQRRGLKRIILPESILRVEDRAFQNAGRNNNSFDQLYIPKTIEHIGESAFWGIGPNTSYRGFFQGNLTSIPDFITTGNCTSYGIDEEAVEDYERRIGRRK